MLVHVNQSAPKKADADEWLARTEAMARKGLRTVALAYKPIAHNGGAWPRIADITAADYTLLSLVFISDSSQCHTHFCPKTA